MSETWCDFSGGLTCQVCGYKAARLPTYRLCAPPDETGSPESEPPAASHPAPTHGPGTELSKLLKRFGIEPTPTCQCRAKAAQMDAWGCDECSKPERVEEVVAVMREEAKARGLPFVDAAGRVLVKRAIQNARKATIR